MVVNPPSNHRETYGPPCPFRAVGFTWKAGFNRLSPTGQAIIAEHNGTTVEAMPFGFRFSSSQGMHAWIETLGARKAQGLSTRHTSGRWLLPSEIA